MRWNLTIAVVIGFVLAMALTFGGHVLRGPVVPPPQHSSN
jgi:hypothetical protein